MDKFEFTFESLMESRADVWNNNLAESLGMTVDSLKDIIMLRNLDIITEDVAYRINKKFVLNTYSKRYEKFGATEAFHNYVIEFSDNDFEPKALSITGKIIIGVNLANSVFNESYFNNCIFYKCNLSGSAFETCTFNSCIFNNCIFDGSDCTASTIYKTRFYECSLSETIFDYCNINDSMFTVCKLSYAHFKQCNILATGFIDCEMFNGDFKDIKMTLITITNCDLSKSSFRRATIIDGIWIRLNLKECDFSQMCVTSLTTTCCDYDPTYATLFQISTGLYSPSSFEWDDVYEDNDIDFSGFSDTYEDDE